MKKITSQIAVALVCALLGFLLAYQFKLLNSKEKATVDNFDKSDIIAENENLRKEKESLISKNESLTENLKKIEQAAAARGDVNQETKNELDKTRMMLGTEDVKGKGIILTLTPKNNMLSEKPKLSEFEIIYLINILNFAGAEAISINDYRITPQTGVVSAAGDKIWIGNNDPISPTGSLEIKAIGNQVNLKKQITFPGYMSQLNLGNYSYEIKNKDDMLIKKSNQNLVSEFIKPVQ
ncbi:Uncharacterized conserved protein YlxW, UPF0749 family [Clostridium cavendishii DSM 21758]|uniref:Uncharacterized conserved protein YlxW, UPF0749 family n=1 Tax=Clostridium cavendishii DSM 21758 TaxID=1121302 RepID=A0A1M6KPH5_9CLOT|nr:DUF881 domain-containing protein [Clostridium cavendishii]SHJ60802.1 Uncharacterized conserved protein YlxW, UPF0749 family [Clostridium cavendishii DSM 21758]